MATGGGSAPRYARIVVGIVLAMVLVATCVGVAAARLFAPAITVDRIKVVSIGPFQFVLSTELPPAQIVWFAVGAMAAIAIVALLLEAITSLLALRPPHVRGTGSGGLR